MAHQNYELADTLDPASTSHVRLGSRKTLLSSSDMVIPMLCGVFLHLFYISLLLPILILYFNDDEFQACMSVSFEIYLLSALLIHAFTLTTNILSTVIAFQTKVLNTSRWLNILLSIRLFLNLFEVISILFGFYVLFLHQHNVHCFDSQSDDEILSILIMFNLLSNLCIVLLTWCVLLCCCTKSDTNSNSTNIIESRQSYNSVLHRYFSICFYDQKSPKLSSTFNEMGGLITILVRGNPYDNLELTPSDIVTGLHLLRMLQKHYGLFDEKFYFPYKHQNALASDLHSKLTQHEQARLKALEYYTLYANAAYGIGLYTLSKPCSICCAPPCFLPTDFQQADIELHRNPKCCCNGVQLDNSNLKVFMQRTGVNINELLLVAQIGDLHKVNFYVAIDEKQKALVIALRGTMSIQDSITDAECNPLHFPEIAEKCYVHSGIGQCAKYVFDIIIENGKILQFLRMNPEYDVVVSGHSLGAGVCVVLSLMLNYGTHANLDLFINDRHQFRAYAIAPPSCIEREFALKHNEEISQWLTCIIFGYDIIPRLSFKGVVFTRAAINRLLHECVQTPWWIYEKAITMKHNTIINALKFDTKYCKNYVQVVNEPHSDDDDVAESRSHDEERDDVERKYQDGDEKEAAMPGEECFMRDVLEDVANMEQISIEHNLSSPQLWNTRFCQTGYIFHVTKAEGVLDENADAMGLMMQTENVECIQNVCGTCWRSVVCNVLRCRLCLDDESTQYLVYRADPDLFCDQMLISPYLIADHMPQVYLNALEKVIKNQI